VLVESLDDPALRLVCPLCGGQFDAAAVTAESEPAPPLARPVVAESPPPENLPAEQPATEEQVAATMAAEGAALEESTVEQPVADEVAAESEPAAEFGSIAATMSALAGAPPPAEVVEAEASESATVDESEEAPEHQITVAEGSLPEHRVSGPRVQQRTEGEAPLVVAPPERGEEDAYAIAGATTGAAGDDAEPAWDAMSNQDVQDTLRSSMRMRPRERPVGFLGHLLGVVLGGAIGIGLGYLLLIWIAGRQGDFMRIWDKIPSFLRPSELMRF
jgi:hypothetical protein